MCTFKARAWSDCTPLVDLLRGCLAYLVGQAERGQQVGIGHCVLICGIIITVVLRMVDALNVGGGSFLQPPNPLNDMRLAAAMGSTARRFKLADTKPGLA